MSHLSKNRAIVDLMIGALKFPIPNRQPSLIEAYFICVAKKHTDDRDIVSCLISDVVSYEDKMDSERIADLILKLKKEYPKYLDSEIRGILNEEMSLIFLAIFAKISEDISTFATIFKRVAKKYQTKSFESLVIYLFGEDPFEWVG